MSRLDMHTLGLGPQFPQGIHILRGSAVRRKFDGSLRNQVIDSPPPPFSLSLIQTTQTCQNSTLFIQKALDLQELPVLRKPNIPESIHLTHSKLGSGN